jgi:hypothetical protein
LIKRGILSIRNPAASPIPETVPSFKLTLIESDEGVI